MRTPKKLLAVAAAAAAVAFAISATANDNLLNNGSFDTGLQGWHVSAPECASVRWDPGGWVSVEAICSSVSKEAGIWQDVQVSGVSHLFLSFNARTSGLDGLADLVITFYDENGSTLWKTGTHGLAGTGSWSSYRWAILVPEGSTTCRVAALAKVLVAGEVSFDEISLEVNTGAGYRHLTVDCASVTGQIRNLLQANRTPFHRDGSGVDPELLRQAGIRMLRIHDDYTGLPISHIFPNPNADPDDPASYDFEDADWVMEKMAEYGFEPLVRLGEPWEGPSDPRMPAPKWARVVANVVRHFNLGWANGSHYGIRYWEIWNEPNGGHTWSGTAEEYYQLYVEAASAIKAVDPEAKVGGPAMAGFSGISWAKGFLQAVRQAGAPLDFFTWHTYHMGNPLHLADAQRTVRELLDEEGFQQVEVFPDEWNLSAGTDCQETNCTAYTTTAYSAAHAVSGLIYLQDTSAPFCFRYRLDGYLLFGLFGYGDDEPEFAPSGLAYTMLAAFDEAPLRLATTGGDLAGYTLMAGKAEGSGGEVVVVVSDPGSAVEGYELEILNPPVPFKWEVREIADPFPWLHVGDQAPLIASGVVEEDGGEGRVTLSMPMQAPAVHMIVILPLGPEEPRLPSSRLWPSSVWVMPSAVENLAGWVRGL